MTDFDNRFGRQLVAWRKSESLTQVGLALRLGVSQQAVSRWERGEDEPDRRNVGKIKALMRTASSLAVENAFIKDQAAIRTLINFDGVEILGTSRGFKTIWPLMSKWEARSLEDKMTGETGTLVHYAENRAGVLRGEIVMAAGVSLRHLDLDLDAPVKHRWFARFRKLGALVVADMSFEPCDPADPVGMHHVLRVDDLSI